MVPRSSGQVEIEAFALAPARLLRIAPEEGIEALGMGMDRDGEHIGAVIEDRLRAVAVVDVDVEDGGALSGSRQQRRGDGGVVEVAEARRHVGGGVVAGRAAQRIGQRSPCSSKPRAVGGRGGTGAGGLPGRRGDGA